MSIRISSTGVSPSSLGCSKTIRLSSLNSTWWSATPKNKSFGLASFPFARRYLGNRCFFLLLGLLRCFSSPRFLILRYFIHTAVPAHYYRWVPPFGNLRFITDICSLPQLIAACHVLRRLLVPRHPPYALFNLTVNSSKIIVKTLSENFFSGFSV